MSNKKLSTETRKWATPGRRGKMNASKWRKVMEDLEVTGNLGAAAAHNGISKSTIYKYMEKFPELKDEYEIARETAVRNLELEAYRRAVTGVDVPIVYQGEIIDYQKQYSDQILLKLLSANDPVRWSNKTSVEVNHQHDLSGDAKNKLSQLLGITNQSEDSEDGVIEGEWSESNDDDED